jgi:xylulose-5-phosphate/fructose-6-phosphate phosphoketolase
MPRETSIRCNNVQRADHLAAERLSEQPLVESLRQQGLKMDASTTAQELQKRNHPTGAAGGEPTLTAEELRKTNAFWRAANYLSVGQIYLYDNPLLREPLKLAHVKPLVVGHWGTTPGQNFIYVHLNRVI